MRQPTTKDIAEYFRLTLEAGLSREKEIEAWADKMIVETSSPTPEWLLNLSIGCETSKNKLLQSIAGEFDQITVWNLVIARLGESVHMGQSQKEHAVRTLFRWAVGRMMPEDYATKAYVLDDGFDGVKAGWFSDKQFQTDFDTFFSRFRPFESMLPKQVKDQK